MDDENMPPTRIPDLRHSALDDKERDQDVVDCLDDRPANGVPVAKFQSAI